MDIDVELYRGDEYVGETAFGPVLRAAARLRFGDAARYGQIQFELEEPAEAEPYPGPPELRNRSADLGHCRVRMVRDGETIREERMRVSDLLGPALTEKLYELEPDETRWSFQLRQRRVVALVLTTGDHLSGAVRPTPQSEGAVEVDLGERRHRPFTLTPMAGAEAQVVEPEGLGLDPKELGRLNILLPAEIHDQLVRGMSLSDRMEEGGFLLGRVTKAADEVHLVEVTHVTPAHRSGAGMVHFTFTGESFLAVAQLIAERGLEEELVGWYHTHLTGVDHKMGLSSIDIDLHLATFQRPWQVAALVNLRRDQRVLRFYGRGEDGLEEYHQWIADDSGRYRRADSALGGD